MIRKCQSRSFQKISYIDTRGMYLCLLTLQGWHDVNLEHSVTFLLLSYVNKWRKWTIGGNATNTGSSKGCAERKGEEGKREEDRGEKGKGKEGKGEKGRGRRLLLSPQDPLRTVCLDQFYSWVSMLSFHHLHIRILVSRVYTGFVNTEVTMSLVRVVSIV